MIDNRFRETVRFDLAALRAYLSLPHVSVVRQAAKKWRMPNSVAFTIMPIPLMEVGPIPASGRDENRPLLVSVNFISVCGPRSASEELHYHTSAIVGIVTDGSGFVDYQDNNMPTSAEIVCGDVVIIPHKALHTFHTKEGGHLDYAVLEFGPDADGQKHHYHEEPPKHSE